MVSPEQTILSCGGKGLSVVVTVKKDRALLYTIYFQYLHKQLNLISHTSWIRLLLSGYNYQGDTFWSACF